MCIRSLSCMLEVEVTRSESEDERRSVVGGGEDSRDVLSLLFVVTISTGEMWVTKGGEAAVVLVMVTIGMSPSMVAVFFMRPVAIVLSVRSNGEECFNGLSIRNEADEESADVAAFRIFGINTNRFADDAIIMLFIVCCLFVCICFGFRRLLIWQYSYLSLMIDEAETLAWGYRSKGSTGIVGFYCLLYAGIERLA